MPNPDDLMVAAGGVLFENPRDAAEAYPALWPNKEAAKKAFQTAKVGSFPCKESISGETPHLRRSEYQRAGRGQQPATAWFDPGLVPDLADWLTTRLGALAWCHTGADPDPPPTPNAHRDAPRPQPPDPPAEPMPAERGPWWDDAAPDWSAADLERLMGVFDHNSDRDITECEAILEPADQPDGALLDPGRVHVRMPIGLSLVEPNDEIVRLPPGAAARAALRGDLAFDTELRRPAPRELRLAWAAEAEAVEFHAEIGSLRGQPRAVKGPDP